jgi:rod shape-determining protein MreB
MRGAFSAGPDLAVDLGTASSRLAIRGRGVVLEVPSAVALQMGPRGREIVAVGLEAKKMLGKAPAGTEVVRPVRGGVVTDFQATEHLLRDLLHQAGARGLIKPRILISVPSSHTEVERRAVQESARAAGCREVSLVPSPMAAALGAELPIQKPLGSMVIDIGAGRTEMAVISLGGMVVRRSLPVAGDAMDEAIVAWLRQRHDLMVGDRTGEAIKLRSGCAMTIDPPASTRIRGRDMNQGVPRELDVSSRDVVEALEPVLRTLRSTLLDVLRETPPELASDILEHGIVLCGGSSRLRRLDHLFRDATELPIVTAEEPTRCVADGLSKLLEDNDLLERVVIEA